VRAKALLFPGEWLCFATSNLLGTLGNAIYWQPGHDKELAAAMGCYRAHCNVGALTSATASRCRAPPVCCAFVPWEGLLPSPKVPMAAGWGLIAVVGVW